MKNFRAHKSILIHKKIQESEFESCFIVKLADDDNSGEFYFAR